MKKKQDVFWKVCLFLTTTTTYYISSEFAVFQWLLSVLNQVFFQEMSLSLSVEWALENTITNNLIEAIHSDLFEGIGINV